MNKAQYINLAITVIVGLTGAFVEKLGVSTTDYTKDLTDFFALAIGALSAYRAHQFHGSPIIVSQPTEIQNQQSK